MANVTRVLCLTALAMVSVSACARAHAPGAMPPNAAATGASLERGASGETAPPVEAAPFAQKPGDFVVYRFSGTFRKTPLVLAQRVVEGSDTTLVIESTFDDGKTKRTVRTRYSHAPGAAHELTGVWRVDAAGGEKALPAAEYDAMMAETTLPADSNEGAIGSERVTVKVAGRSLDCTQTTYRVVVGKRHATMRTLTSDAFAWGDVGGEITADDGKVLYRAEMIDTGGATPMLTVSR